MSTDIPKIGTTLNVFTFRDIRYQGRLASVCRDTESITLERVRSFGTEDRVQAREEFVRAQQGVYDRVEFNVKNIKDIKLAYRGIEDDPAILNQPVVHRNAHPTHNGPHGNRGYGNTQYNNYNSTFHHQQGRQRFDNRNFTGNFQDRIQKSMRGRDGQFHLTSPAKVAAELQKDFDFEKANEAFKKEPDAKTTEAGDGEDGQAKSSENNDDSGEKTDIPEVVKDVGYNKGLSFFDHLTSDGMRKQDHNHEAKKNMETFNLPNSSFQARSNYARRGVRWYDNQRNQNNYRRYNYPSLERF